MSRREIIEEIAGAIALAIMGAVLFVGYLWATPEQSSGINDLDAEAEAALVAEGGAE